MKRDLSSLRTQNTDLSYSLDCTTPDKPFSMVIMRKIFMIEKDTNYSICYNINLNFYTDRVKVQAAQARIKKKKNRIGCIFMILGDLIKCQANILQNISLYV